MIDFGFGVNLGPISDITAKQLRTWRNHPDIYKWCRQYEPLEQWSHQKWISSMETGRDDVHMYGIFAKSNGYGQDIFPAGVCGLTSVDHINQRAEFSIYIGKECQGHQYGLRALKTLVKHGFNALNLNHIFGETFDGNPAAKTFEKVGFKKEGTRRSFYFRDGKFIDAHLYSILRSDEEWKQWQ